jgi:hypothetical protein
MKTNKKRGSSLFFYFWSALNLSTMYKKILKFNVEGADSGFFPSPTIPVSFLAGIVFEVLFRLLATIEV